MNNTNLTEKKYWNNNYNNKAFFCFSKSVYSFWLEKYLKEDSKKNCIEIGAFPGGNLGYMAKKFKYKPTAIDFVDDISFIKANMIFNGIDNCKLIHTDFLTWQPDETFDVVCSHGFIEHFENYEFVINKHIKLLKKNGILIVSVPYLKYFQLWIRKLLYQKDKYNEIMKIHNLDIMDIDELNKIIFNSHKDIEKVFSGFIRGMTIWFPGNDETIKKGTKIFYLISKFIQKIVNKLNISNKYFSPEILIIAKKR